jgi:hypothetical protein
MGLIKTKEKTPVRQRIDELMSQPIDRSIRDPLKQSLKQMEREGKGIEEIEQFYKETVAKTLFIEERREEYVREAKLADKVYKSYITDGVSRLEKINGRFLASLSIKTDILIEQNNRIIQLLELQTNGNKLETSFCPECGTENEITIKNCKECGANIN